MTDSASHMEVVETKATVPLTAETYRKAFRTKALLNESKQSKLIKLDAQRQTQLKQIHPYATWIMDIVSFGTGQYLLFVEANTRYAVIHLFHRDAVRVKRSIADLMEHQYVGKIVGDADKVFTAGIVKDFCTNNGILYDFRKTEDTAHTHVAILDRVVRTFRDMLYNLNVKDPTPPDIANVAKIYNETRHETLSQVLGFNATPKLLNENHDLQMLFTRRLAAMNWSKIHRSTFIIPNGRRVFVRAKYGKMAKKRSTVDNEIYTVVSHKGSLYTLSNKEGKIITVPRRDLRVCNVK